ncbi:hypothetical protein ASF77_17860 [Massilia sp. Leaf139]|nr:hypothetical protein ASF77_17860 [Massilia sp. Leaf139]
MAACRYTEVGALPLRYAGPGLHVMTDGSINGTPATMLVDTGSPDVVLSSNGVARHKLPLRSTSQTLHGVGGEAAIYTAQVDSLSAGPVKTGSATVSVVTEFGGTPAFDAIVASRFLLQADMELSLATKELRFFRPTGCAERHLAYWDPAAMVIPFEASSKADPNPRFTILVNGQKMRAMIDSGTRSTLIGLKAAQRAGLKLDAPGVTRVADSGGFGSKHVARWVTSFDTFQIGDETVLNAEVGVIDWDGHVDVLLGTDFLRSHRVLFAMGQRKLYLSHVGGETFSQGRTLEPWIVQEAEAGNPDAQFRLALAYLDGAGVARNPTLGGSWMDKAAKAGSAAANRRTGRRLMLEGFPAEGAARLRTALDKLPADGEAALWLYLARVRSKQPELAGTELAASFAHNKDNAWPMPLADFYLGKRSEEAVLKAAAAQAATAKTRTCEALTRMSEWHNVHGDLARARTLSEQFKAGCGRPGSGAGGV